MPIVETQIRLLRRRSVLWEEACCPQKLWGRAQAPLWLGGCPGFSPHCAFLGL